MADRLLRAPATVPSDLAPDVERLHSALRTLMDNKGLPYLIQAAIAKKGYTTCEDVADLYDSPEKAREFGPAEWGFASVTPPAEGPAEGWTKDETRFAALKLFQTVRQLHLQRQTPFPTNSGTPSGSVPRSATSLLVDATCDRGSCEEAMAAITKLGKPSLQHQASDFALKKQFGFCSKGSIGNLQVKHLIPYFPEEDEKGKTKKGRTQDEDEEVREWPRQQRTVERWFLIFRTNLFMCMAMFPQHKQFNASWQDLEAFYTWLQGPEIGAKRPPPSPGILLAAERKAWALIEQHLHGGMHLKEALLEVRNSTLFWQREIYERCYQENSSGKGPSWIRDRSRTPVGKGPKGTKGKGKSKGKGKKGSKSNDSSGPRPPRGAPNPAAPSSSGGQWPANWSKKDPRGTEFCQKYHLHNNCQGSCGRSHHCPVMRAGDSYVCNAPPRVHKPANCPMLNQ